MTELLMKVFKQNMQKLINVSFYKLDPATKTLIIYNSEKAVGRVELEVKDEYGDKYQALIPAMEANQEYLLPIEKIKSTDGQPISAEIISITARVSNNIEHFRRFGKEFKRA